MADTEDDFDKAFEGFGEEPGAVTPPTTPPADPPKSEEPPKDETPPAPTEEPKKDEEPKKEDTETPPAADDLKKEETPKPPETPETPPAEEAPKPLTLDDIKSVVNEIRTEERNSGKEFETTTQEVLEKYYPDGLSNTLIDEASGRPLKTPQDVVEASSNTMSTEEAAQWLLNEQYKLDKQVSEIKDNARQIAETTVKFKRDAVTALEKYEPLFKAYPQLQTKVYEKLMKQVKIDKDKGVILSAPDVIEHYDDYLEPYQQAFEYGTNTPATNPTGAPETPPAKPSAEDRMDISGDGGQTPPNDPNDFAQQVSKELAKGI